jgi:hypothetical protein
LSAPRMVCPCGSSTVGLKETYTRAFMLPIVLRRWFTLKKKTRSRHTFEAREPLHFQARRSRVVKFRKLRPGGD